MKNFLFLLVLLTAYNASQAQKITPNDLKALQKKEDSLRVLAKNIIVDSTTAGRMRNDSLFIRTLVRALQVKNSFYYSMDSVRGISKLYSPDSSFRIFTWSLSFDDYYSRQRGAIQMRTADGSLKLVPLKDYSEFTNKPTDSIRSKDNWIGAVYYNIIKTQYNGKNFYTMFGIDYHTVRSNRKWIEVMTFNEKKLPVFGGVFSFEEDTVKRPSQHRYFIEYKEEASTLVNYVDDEKMILIDHLISESDEPENAYTLVPDGDYEGFKWKNGKWVHVDKVFNIKLEDGDFPIPNPLHNDEKEGDDKVKKPVDKKKKKG